MPTKIYSANITLGDEPNNIILEKEVVKKLPVHILMSNVHFIGWIKHKIGDVKYKKLLNKKTGLLTVKINYLKEIGNINNEPIIEG